VRVRSHQIQQNQQQVAAESSSRHDGRAAACRASPTGSPFGPCPDRLAPCCSALLAGQADGLESCAAASAALSDVGDGALGPAGPAAGTRPGPARIPSRQILISAPLLWQAPAWPAALACRCCWRAELLVVSAGGRPGDGGPAFCRGKAQDGLQMLSPAALAQLSWPHWRPWPRPFKALGWWLSSPRLLSGAEFDAGATFKAKQGPRQHEIRLCQAARQGP